MRNSSTNFIVLFYETKLSDRFWEVSAWVLIGAKVQSAFEKQINFGELRGR